MRTIGLEGGPLLEVNTTRFGKVSVKEADVVELPQGLIGFPELKRYVLLDHDKESPFKWFQSLDDGAIAFVLINPLLFKPDYEVEVTESEVSGLALVNEEDAVISVIVTMPSNPQNMTANLKAPLIFNLQNRKGRQIILNDSQYTTRHNIMEEMKKHVDVAEGTKVKDAISKAKEAQETAEAAAKDNEKAG